MKEKDCRQVEMVQSNMRVILQFPKESEKDEHTKKEVKEILSGILKEQLDNRKGKTIL